MKIEKGIPILGSNSKYPFGRMEVGDSVFIEGAKSQGKEYGYAQQIGQKNGWKFSGRSEDGGLRIWRVA